MAFAGSALAGVSWIVVLSALLWNTGEDDVLPALLLDFHSRTFPYPFTIQNLMWIVFFVGAGELLLRHVAGTAEGRQLSRALLPEDDGTVLRGAELGSLYREVRRSDPDGRYWLQRLLTTLIPRFRSSGSPDQVNAVFSSSLDLYQHESELHYNLLRYLVWLIPTLGFIGTVTGIALALGEAGVFLSSAGAEAGVSPAAIPEPGAGPDPAQVRSESMQTMISQLGVAFYTTLLALLQSAVLMATMHVVQGREERALNQVGQYCLRNFVNRLAEGRRSAADAAGPGDGGAERGAAPAAS